MSDTKHKKRIARLDTAQTAQSLLKFSSLRFVLFLFFVSVLLFLSSDRVFAQTQPGITVIPSIMHVDLATDPAEYELTYINNTTAEITLLLSVRDFTALENNYAIDFLTGQDAANYKYSLSSWISFENKMLQLNPGEKKSVKIFIDKNRITKGGHYASILAEIQQPEAKNQVAVKGVLSSLLFVRASTGKEIEEGKIVDFMPVRDWIEYPNIYQVRFENNGNVQVVPYGSIQVFDPLGNLVAKGPFNIDSLDALPESIRRYRTSVTTYQKVLLPGIYTAKIDLQFGKTNQKLSATTKFFSQGMFDFGKIGIGLAIILLVVFYHRRRKSRIPLML
jgi:hypothetical protein